MAAKSKLEVYDNEIRVLISSGASIRSSWKIMRAMLPNELNISYSAFYHYVKVHIE